MLFMSEIKSSIQKTIIEMGKNAKSASLKSMLLNSDDRNRVLISMANILEEKRNKIKEINQKDMDKGKRNGLSDSFLDRLLLTDNRIDEMIKGLTELANKPDILGNISEMLKRPNGLLIGKLRVPLGVVAMIYESRPNVTVDATGICIKSGNVILLRGGSEAFHSNLFLAQILKEAATKAGFPEYGIQIIDTIDREAVDHLFKLREYIDVLIPRGNAKFIQKVVQNSQVPVIETGAGNCHTYVHSDADVEMAINIVYNGKVQRPSVCNATKKVLIHKDIADKIIPDLKRKMEEVGVIFLVHPNCKQYFPNAEVISADSELWAEEFLDMRLGVKIVSDIQEAIQHINKYNSKHTETIVSKSYEQAQIFINSIDAAALNWNASTRFTDGGVYGMGAEIGISTQKIHARGPLGIKQLTTQKYIVFGTGQIRP